MPTLLVHIQSQLHNLRDALNERFETQTKATETAFTAQQQAMSTALAAAEKAVAVAMMSAEKAVTKAEIAADKRFELLNELRIGVATKEQLDVVEHRLGDLSSLTAGFVQRDEVDMRIRVVADKLDAESKRLSARINDLSSRVDQNQGSDVGSTAQAASERANAMRMIAAMGLLLTVVSVAVAAFVAFGR